MRFRVVEDQSDIRVSLLARLGRGKIKKLVQAKAKGRRLNNNVGSSPKFVHIKEINVL